MSSVRDRIPLWIDLRDVPAQERQPFEAAAKAVGAERIVSGPVADAIEVRMDDGAAQAAAAELPGPVIVDGGDWTIIPLENLIAARRDRPGTLYAVARDATQAGVLRDTLEVGVHGVVLRPQNVEQVVATDKVLRAKGVPVAADVAAPTDFLQTAEITSIEDAGPADRVCVDATSRFEDGEGLLVGSTARAFLLIHAETLQSDFVAPRPFRVNAGALHSYVLAPDGKTRYLSELSAGAKLMAVRHDGSTRDMVVGRAKIEHRPHLLVRFRLGPTEGSVVVQNAETIRLVRPGGGAVSVTDLAPGDRVVGHAEAAARHFGMPVDEKLEER